MAQTYTRLSLQKNGAVTNLVGYNLLQQPPPITPVPFTNTGDYQVPTSHEPLPAVDNSLLGSALNSAVNSVFSNVNTQLGLHEIDIIATVIGILILIVAVSAIARPLV